MNVLTAGDVLPQIVAIGTAAGVIGKFTKGMISNGIAELTAPIAVLSEKVDLIAVGLEEVRKEVKVNGGGTLKDSVDRLEAALSAQMLVDQSPQWRSDKNGKYILVNAALCSLVGHPESDILAHGWRSCVADDDYDRVVAHWSECIDQKRTFDTTFKYKRADGSVTPAYRVQCTPMITTQTKEVTGYLGKVSAIK